MAAAHASLNFTNTGCFLPPSANILPATPDGSFPSDPFHGCFHTCAIKNSKAVAVQAPICYCLNDASYEKWKLVSDSLCALCPGVNEYCGLASAGTYSFFVTFWSTQEVNTVGSTSISTPMILQPWFVALISILAILCVVSITLAFARIMRKKNSSTIEPRFTIKDMERYVI